MTDPTESQTPSEDYDDKICYCQKCTYDRLRNNPAPAPEVKADPLREALQKIADLSDSEAGEPLDDAIEIARAALAAPLPPAPITTEQLDREAPVAWIVLSTDADHVRIWWRDKERAEQWAAEHGKTLIPLYAKPFTATDFLALSPPATTDRAAVIEECAKVCDRWIRSKNLHESLAATDIASAIRALVDAKEEGK